MVICIEREREKKNSRQPTRLVVLLFFFRSRPYLTGLLVKVVRKIFSFFFLKKTCKAARQFDVYWEVGVRCSSAHLAHTGRLEPVVRVSNCFGSSSFLADLIKKLFDNRGLDLRYKLREPCCCCCSRRYLVPARVCTSQKNKNENTAFRWNSSAFPPIKSGSIIGHWIFPTAPKQHCSGSPGCLTWTDFPARFVPQPFKKYSLVIALQLRPVSN